VLLVPFLSFIGYYFSHYPLLASLCSLGSIYVIVLSVRGSQQGENKYGLNPKGNPALAQHKTAPHNKTQEKEAKERISNVVSTVATPRSAKEANQYKVNNNRKIVGYLKIACLVFIVLLASSSILLFYQNSKIKELQDNINSQRNTTAISSPLPSTTLNQTTISTPTIMIGFSGVTTNRIGVASPKTPEQYYTFLIVTYTIINNGYSQFSVSPFYFNVMINAIKYNYDSSSNYVDKYFPTVTVMEGGTLTGQLAYQIPSYPANVSFNPVYEGVANYNIQWTPQSGVATPTTFISNNSIEVKYSQGINNVPPLYMLSGLKPSAGYDFFSVTYTIRNNSPDGFLVIPSDFHIIIDSIKYNYDTAASGDKTKAYLGVSSTMVVVLTYQIPIPYQGFSNLSFSPTWDDSVSGGFFVYFVKQ